MKRNFIFVSLLCIVSSVFGQQDSSGVDSLQLYFDAIEASLQYQTGKIQLGEVGSINVPKGFRYLNSEQSEKVLHDLWGNPEGSGSLGMLVPDNTKVSDSESYAFIISYEDMGYVEDDDADDINYDDLLEEMQGDIKTSNEERAKLGYETVQLVGWASTPFYDKEKKVLHWAKELKFGESEANTLNYNIRILGRKGVVVLNAVASMSQLDLVKPNIDQMTSSFAFNSGLNYADFNPDIDEVAAWTIGGLVAGKVLAKVGILAFLLKYIKIIALAVIGLGSGAVKWFRRKTEVPTVRTLPGENNPPA